jgi:hypothetical protein
VRRKFFDVHAAIGSPIAKEALDRIGQLYLNGINPQQICSTTLPASGHLERSCRNPWFRIGAVLSRLEAR